MLQSLNEMNLKSYNTWVRTINKGNYRPYLTVRKVNKFGRRHWIWCDKQNREVHLLSDGERRAYDIMISMPGTVSIFEQYALDIAETISIAKDLGFVHPRNYKTNQLSVMTTDFIVVTQAIDQFGASVLKRIAYSFKYSTDLYTDPTCSAFLKSATRTIQKLKIEQEYWKRRDIEYRIITELHATKECAWNIEFCKIGFKNSVDKDLAVMFSTVLYEIWGQNRYMDLSSLLNSSAVAIGVDPAAAEQLFYFCVLNRLINLVHSSYLQKHHPIQLE